MDAIMEKAAPRALRGQARPPTGRRWSAEVMATSDALDLEPATFKQRSARGVAEALKRAAERSSRRKTTPFRSAMSMLTFYINRGGRNLSATRRRTLERAKDELRVLFGRPPRRPARAGGRRRRG